jgi:hypothetical protein
MAAELAGGEGATVGLLRVRVPEGTPVKDGRENEPVKDGSDPVKEGRPVGKPEGRPVGRPVGLEKDPVGLGKDPVKDPDGAWRSSRSAGAAKTEAMRPRRTRDFILTKVEQRQRPEN